LSHQSKQPILNEEQADSEKDQTSLTPQRRRSNSNPLPNIFTTPAPSEGTSTGSSKGTNDTPVISMIGSKSETSLDESTLVEKQRQENSQNDSTRNTLTRETEVSPKGISRRSLLSSSSSGLSQIMDPLSTNSNLTDVKQVTLSDTPLAVLTPNKLLDDVHHTLSESSSSSISLVDSQHISSEPHSYASPIISPSSSFSSSPLPSPRLPHSSKANEGSSNFGYEFPSNYNISNPSAITRIFNGAEESSLLFPPSVYHKSASSLQVTKSANTSALLSHQTNKLGSITVEESPLSIDNTAEPSMDDSSETGLSPTISHMRVVEDSPSSTPLAIPTSKPPKSTTSLIRKPFLRKSQSTAITKGGNSSSSAETLPQTEQADKHKSATISSILPKSSSWLTKSKSSSALSSIEHQVKNPSSVASPSK
jgi:hypothetical protein